MGTAICCIGPIATHLFTKSVSCRSAKFTTGDFECMVRLKKFALQKYGIRNSESPRTLVKYIYIRQLSLVLLNYENTGTISM